LTVVDKSPRRFTQSNAQQIYLAAFSEQVILFKTEKMMPLVGIKLFIEVMPG